VSALNIPLNQSRQIKQSTGWLGDQTLRYLRQYRPFDAVDTAADHSGFPAIKFFTPMGSGNYNFPNMGARLGMSRVRTLITPAFHLLEIRLTPSNLRACVAVRANET